MITGEVGAAFEIELGAAPTTGYMWQLEAPPAGVRLLDSGFEQPANAAVGDGGTQIFRLQADEAGHYELHFELKRRWETEPIETRVVEVDAR